MKDLENYTLPELEAEKQRLKKVANMILIGTISYAAVVFYFMYNDPDNDGRLLLLVPIAILMLIINVIPKKQRVNRLINTKK